MTQDAVARVWSGAVPVEHAGGFFEHLLTTGVAEARALDGCLGATVLRREEAGCVRFTLLTFWRDEVAVTGFATGNAAIHYPGDETFGLVPAETAVHHTVVLDVRRKDRAAMLPYRQW